MIQIQADRVGSDILGSMFYAAFHSFARFPSDDKYLFVFSDMQQSGPIRRCILNGTQPKKCLRLYLRANPDFAKANRALDGVAVYVSLLLGRL